MITFNVREVVPTNSLLVIEKSEKIIVEFFTWNDYNVCKSMLILSMLF